MLERADFLRGKSAHSRTMLLTMKAMRGKAEERKNPEIITVLSLVKQWSDVAMYRKGEFRRSAEAD